ncbi:hypothetical protein TUM4637_04890 [Shewanella hafniensis]|nr:hypothetical protein TUM4637_04890 [Shewanella hafniensis]
MYQAPWFLINGCRHKKLALIYQSLRKPQAKLDRPFAKEERSCLVLNVSKVICHFNWADKAQWLVMINNQYQTVRMSE